MAVFLEQMTELEKGGKVCVGKKISVFLFSFIHFFSESVLFTVHDTASYRESSGILQNQVLHQQIRVGQLKTVQKQGKLADVIHERNLIHLLKTTFTAD